MTIALRATDKRDGRVYTPDPVAEALCHWAIRSSADVVLDLGVGEGAFLLAAGRRLLGLGATPADARRNVYGAEKDASVFRGAQAAVRDGLGFDLPNVLHADFYTATLPAATAVVGNPPYIRRHYQPDPAGNRRAAGMRAAAGLTDAYCYFLIRACSAIPPGGRLAVIVSASWLDMRYGEELKRLLLDAFDIRLLLAFDGRVFANALVKPVLLLAERHRANGPVPFAVLPRGQGLQHLTGLVTSLEQQQQQQQQLPQTVPGRVVPRAQLSPHEPWSGFLRAPETRDAVLAASRWAPLEDLAASRIGLQTFAKPFYVLTRAEAQRQGIEPQFTLPLVHSPRDAQSPVLASADAVRHVVFACDEPLTRLHGTRAGAYVARAMQATVPVRGSDQVVQGYHRAPRLARARREPWYDIRTEIQRRGSYPILLPRRAFTSFLVVHNQARVVANEDFIEISPWAAAHVEPLLAFLNSSTGEFLVRSQAFQYGGGVFNLNPGAVKGLPVPDFRVFGLEQLELLSRAWAEFVGGYPSPSARAALDEAVVAALGVDRELAEAVRRSVQEFVESARSAVVAQEQGVLPGLA